MRLILLLLGLWFITVSASDSDSDNKTIDIYALNAEYLNSYRQGKVNKEGKAEYESLLRKYHADLAKFGDKYMIEAEGRMVVGTANSVDELNQPHNPDQPLLPSYGEQAEKSAHPNEPLQLKEPEATV
ncbi:hypothetical protein DFJ63DRAFT_333105 [Scheffersomyces coipomensis]|uniref:uncharacterized protein n=1 Tax=Scheffersomyces coipomensis TaxID=1788519 RepID=UPI00315C5617